MQICKILMLDPGKFEIKLLYFIGMIEASDI